MPNRLKAALSHVWTEARDWFQDAPKHHRYSVFGFAALFVLLLILGAVQ